MALRELVTILRYELKEGELKRYIDGVKRAEKTINQVAQIASAKLNNALQETVRTTGQMERGTNRVSAAMTRLSQGARQFATGLQQGARQGYEEMLRQMDRVEERHSKLKSKLLLSAAATTGIVAALKSPVANSARFERENQLIGNTAGMNGQQVKALGQTILTEARATNQQADDLQRAIGFLVAAGMDANTAKASIHTIGRTTTAAGADIEDMARAAFTLQDALKIKPSGLQDALDILALAGKEGNVELKDMAKTLPVLGSAFGALKMQGREAAATMAAALEVARKGSATADEAANNLQNFLAKILSPETLGKAQKAFGLDLYQVVQTAQSGGKNPFEAAMTSIMDATGGDQKKIGELFSDMQVQNFLRPMIQNWGEYTRIKNKSLNASAGTTDRDFGLLRGTDAEKMKSAQIAADNLSKALGKALSPSIGEVADKLAVLLNKLTDWINANPALTAAITGTIVGLSLLRTAILALQIASLASVRLRGVGGALGAISDATSGATRGLSGFLGKLGLVGALSDLAIQGLGQLGLPTPEQIAKQGNSVGADNIRNGDWLDASGNLPAGDFLKALWNRMSHSNNEVANMLMGLGNNSNPFAVSPASTINAGRPAMGNITLNSGDVNITAASSNPAAVGAAAQRGTVKSLESWARGSWSPYQMPTPVEAN